ncbi:DnaJ domain-containing protein [Pterulicium gracile]|uniref:DnaJ domain-containing protein n=1 Tax=Pterulicium gracile TaxID=1884261 RepID=A0A5C3QU97_9AGAR|nr:DnaJ domain-containing protein [Pterula gracilis]
MLPTTASTRCTRLCHRAVPPQTFQPRQFSSSAAHCDHYATLGVPHNATKSQIKSNFYKLSKKHHPDLSTDAASPGIYEAIRDAYDTLGNDRSRRLYDRSRMSNTSAGPSNSYTRTTETHRGSAHAWQRSGPRKDTYAPGASRHRAPGASPNYHYSPPHRKDTYNRTKPDTAMDRVARESDFWRAVQVIGGIVIATAISFNLAKG